MSNNHKEDDRGIDLKRGLPMFAASDPAALAKEKAQLESLKNKGFLKRWRWYFSQTGPGWLQSALTLGAGSAMISLFAGASMQYSLLWVQPIAMILGVVMLAAVSYQTLSTGERPFNAIKRILHPSLAWIWVIGSLLTCIIWHIPQYALAAGMAEDMIKVTTGWQPSSGQQTVLLIGLGVLFLVISTAITWSYSTGRKGVRLYERILKTLVWLIIVIFAVVVVRRGITGDIEWGKVFKGFLPLKIPTDPDGVLLVVAGFSAAVGVNSTFLLAYSLLARGWKREHRNLAVFDLISGTLLPFCLVTSLTIIAAGSTIYNTEAFASGGATLLSPTEAAAMFETAGLSRFFSRIVFGLGVLGMTLSTITVHMLMCGFAVCELFGIEPGGWKYRLACLIPAPGIVGVIFWKTMGPWVAVPASAICGLLLPMTYVGFFILNNSKKYLGEDKPSGKKALLWNVAMLIAIAVSIVCACYYLKLQILK